MARSRILTFAGCCIAALGMMGAVAAQSSVAPEAERVAKVYLNAFFAGDVKLAADLTDPKTLERIREAYLAELVKLTDPDAEQAVLANLGIARTTVELSEVDAKTFYVALTQAEHRVNPQVFEAMQRTRFEILGSAQSPNGGITVRVKVINPSGAGAESGLLMRQVFGGWKVVGNTP